MNCTFKTTSRYKPSCSRTRLLRAAACSGVSGIPEKNGLSTLLINQSYKLCEAGGVEITTDGSIEDVASCEATATFESSEGCSVLEADFLGLTSEEGGI